MPKRKIPPAEEWVGQYRNEPWRPELDKWDRASLTVDCILFAVVEGRLNVLLHERRTDPARGSWALPGVFVEYGEQLPDAARRAMKQKVGMNPEVWWHRVSIDNEPNRDPRGWLITLSYVGLIPVDELKRSLEDAFSNVALVAVEAPPGAIINADEVRFKLPDGQWTLGLAHHHDLVRDAILWLRQLDLKDVLKLVPELFTLPELQDVYEAIEARPLDRHSFRRRITKSHRNEVEPTGQHRRVDERHMAELYRQRGTLTTG